jgi:hypothetical protein
VFTGEAPSRLIKVRLKLTGSDPVFFEFSGSMSYFPENKKMSVTKNTTKDHAKSGTIKKANKKKAAMQKVGQKIPEFGVKNMQPGSKASLATRKK